MKIYTPPCSVKLIAKIDPTENPDSAKVTVKCSSEEIETTVIYEEEMTYNEELKQFEKQLNITASGPFGAYSQFSEVFSGSGYGSDKNYFLVNKPK
jgi:hypothetical protein